MRVAILLAVIIFLGSSVKAQSTIDKINGSLYQADKINSTLGTFKGLFSKKKDKKEKDTVATIQSPVVAPKSASRTQETLPVVEKKAGIKTTEIIITGIEFAKLKALNENVRACMGVDSASMKFGSPASMIKVTHTGTTETLMKLISETSKDIFSDKNIISFEEGKVSLKI